MGSCLTTSSLAGASSARPHLHEGPPLAPLRQVDCLPLPPALLIYMRGLPWPPCAMWTASLFLSSSSLLFLLLFLLLLLSLFGFGFILLMFLPQNVNKLAILAQNPKQRPPFPFSHLQEERTRGSRWFVQSTKGRDTK